MAISSVLPDWFLSLCVFFGSSQPSSDYIVFLFVSSVGCHHLGVAFSGYPSGGHVCCCLFSLICAALLSCLLPYPFFGASESLFLSGSLLRHFSTGLLSSLSFLLFIEWSLSWGCFSGYLSGGHICSLLCFLALPGTSQPSSFCTSFFGASKPSFLQVVSSAPLSRPISVPLSSALLSRPFFRSFLRHF